MLMRLLLALLLVVQGIFWLAVASALLFLALSVLIG
jgi:hypothetical protein